MWTGIPVTRLDNEDKEKLKSIENVLSLSVIGQEDAISSLVKEMYKTLVENGHGGEDHSSLYKEIKRINNE